MKRYIAGIFALCLAMMAQAQTVTDTTEVFSAQNDELSAMRQELEAMSERVKRSESNTVIWNNRAKYLNIGYATQRLSGDILGTKQIASDYGLSLSWGKTWYLHQQPIADMLKIGLDWSWLDLNYARYEENSSMTGYSMWQVDAAMQVGPSVTVNPVDRLKASLYFRLSPSYSAMMLDDELAHSYVTFCNFGVSVAWRVLSLGVEIRTGGAEYKVVGIDSNEDDVSLFTGRSPLRTNTTRFYFGLRF